MKVSIITVSFNCKATIEHTIQSVLSQNYNNVEYIIIDGGSTDGTLDIINKYADKISTVVSEPDDGFYNGINKGLKKCTGDIVGLLNADDFYADKDCITEIVNTFNKNNTDAVYADLKYVDAVNTDKVVRNWKSMPYEQGLFLKGWMPPHPTFYAKKSLFDKFGGYDESFKISADYELMLRFIHKQKIKVTYLPKTLVMMRVGGVSNAGLTSRVTANQEDRLAWKKNGVKPSAFTLIRKPLSKIMQYFK